MQKKFAYVYGGTNHRPGLKGDASDDEAQHVRCCSSKAQFGARGTLGETERSIGCTKTQAPYLGKKRIAPFARDRWAQFRAEKRRRLNRWGRKDFSAAPSSRSLQPMSSGI
jgi:hypothetical protein